MTAIAEISTAELSSNTDVNGATLTVKLVGTAETAAMTELDAFLRRLHDTALARKVGEVVIDMRALDFMNSSCFKTLVAWIGQLQETPPDSQYEVLFRADEKKHWQNRSLGALACFAVDLIRVEVA